MAQSAATTTSEVAFEVAALSRLLDGEHAEARERARALMRRPDFARVQGLDTPEYREQVMRWMKALADEGMTARGFPTEVGGEGDVGGYVASFEMLAYSDLSLLVKCGVQFGLFGGAILHLGTERHHRAHLRDVVTAELPGCFAMTESGHGSNVQALRTTATYDPETDELVVRTPDDDARKDYIGNAACHGRMAATFVQLVVGGETHGVHCVLVPIRDEDGRVCDGVRIEDCGPKLGLNGVDNGRIWFDDVRVPRDALLDRYATITSDGCYESPIDNPDRRFFTMLGTLIMGRISVGGAAISATKSALTIAIRHAERRRQFGPPGGDAEALLLDYRVHQRRLLPALARTYALHFAQEHLVAELHRAFTTDDVDEEGRRQLETLAAGVKAAATWHATQTIQTCRECCGGAGYLWENRFGELGADTDVFTTFEGDNTILLQLVAKSLLTGYRDQFGELNPLQLVGFVAGQALETVAERTGLREVAARLVDDLVPGRDEDRDVADRGYHLELFRWREDHMLSGVARRLKSAIDAGGDPFEVFLDCQDHAMNAARAHIETVILECFAAAVERCEDPGVAGVLGRLCDLHVASNVEADRGWFQEHGRLSSTRSKLTTRGVNDLCAQLRPHAEALVDAFAIPDEVLGAPIATRG